MAVVPNKDGMGGVDAHIIGVDEARAGIDRSGSITTGGTAQLLAAANGKRRQLSVQNISTGDLWIRSGVPRAQVAQIDTAGSYKIIAGQPFVVQTNGSVSIIG